MNWVLLLVPLSSAFACWLVIKLLTTMLFRPYKKTSILGITIQGILPVKQSAIAAQIGTLVAEKFFTEDLIKEKITNPAALQKIMPVIEEQIDDFLRHKLKKQLPFISVFVGEKTIGSLKKVFIDELETLLPKILTDYASNLVHDLDIQTLVQEKVKEISVWEIERAFRQNFSSELRLLQILSVFIGLLFGFITALVIFLTK